MVVNYLNNSTHFWIKNDNYECKKGPTSDKYRSICWKNVNCKKCLETKPEVCKCWLCVHEKEYE